MARAPAEDTEAERYRLAESVSHLLHRNHQLAADRFTQLVGEVITLRQFAVLAAIQENQGLSQSDLVRATGVDRSTLADMMNRMERYGWIVRTAAPLDGRALAVTLAGPGSNMLKAITPHALAADAAILDLLPRTKRRTFLAILNKLAKLADEAAAKEAKRRAKIERRQQKKTKTKAAENKPQPRRKREVPQK